ncbi:MAG: hypothetical protein M5U08_19020 [Burkholderiales bacterium]|nr:hypothetical protein [Burkholderiales bacterium]
MNCSAFRLAHPILACEAGQIEQPFAAPVAFRIDVSTGAGSITVTPAAGERWHAVLEPPRAGATARTATLAFEGARVARVRALAPLPVEISAGTAAGAARATLAGGSVQAQGEIILRGVAFSDASGLHAADAVGGRIAFSATAQDGAWRWAADATWSDGEVYWAPVYTKAGFHLAADGTLRDGRLDVVQATLAVPGVGEVRASGAIDLAERAVTHARVETGELTVPPLYERFVKPLAAGTVLGELRTDGRVRAGLTMSAGRLTEASLEVDDLSMEDQRGRFALFGVYASFPWRAGGRTAGRIGMSGAEVQRLRSARSAPRSTSGPRTCAPTTFTSRCSRGSSRCTTCGCGGAKRGLPGRCMARSRRCRCPSFWPTSACPRCRGRSRARSRGCATQSQPSRSTAR